jgi:hypothetical protein
MIDGGVELIKGLLPDLPAPWPTVLALPLLVAALLVLATVAVRLARAADPILRTVGGGLASLLGLLVILPEYLITTALRHLGRRPPAAFHVYGDGVENLVDLGQRASAAGLGGLTRDKLARRVLIVLAVAATVTVSNAGSCDGQAPTCAKPVAVWWDQTTKLILEDEPPPVVKPAKVVKPVKTTKPAKSKP